MRHGKAKIILTGYRASGKTLVGHILASRLGIGFLDTDAEIQKRQGQSIAEMVAAHGWPFFRALEKKMLAELAGREELVIATGGGAIMHEEEWQRLKESGLVVWLQADPATIGQRLAADAASHGQRPSLTGSDVLAEISDLLATREPFYRKGSHLAVDTVNRSAEEIADQILSHPALTGR